MTEIVEVPFVGDKQLAKLKARCQQVFPGNWHLEQSASADWQRIKAGRAVVAQARGPDALAIVEFANAMPDLIAEIESLKERLASRTPGAAV